MENCKETSLRMEPENMQGQEKCYTQEIEINA